MDLNQILFDPTGKVRSGWRFAVFCVGFTLLVLALSGVGLAIPPDAPRTAFRLLSVLIFLGSALFVGWLCGKHLEGLPFRALGASFTRGWLMHLIAGLVVGAVTLGIAVGIAVALGGLRFELGTIEGSRLLTGLITSFLVVAVAAASEEALFRGYPLQTFIRSDLVWLGIIVTSFLFPIAHLRNPDVGYIALINTAVAGVWFGIAYLKTRDLWFVWGLHLMWNWAQGALFGIEISGLTDLTPVSLLREVDSGPAWLTGETYGLEGGIATTIAMVVSTAVIYFLPFLKPREKKW